MKLMKLTAAATLVAACSSFTTLGIAASDADTDIRTKAEALAQSSLIIDTHIDVPYRLNDGFVDVSKATDGGDFDYPRAIAGGLNAPFMSIYTPAALNAADAKVHADKMIAIVEKIVEVGDGRFVIAKTPDEVDAAFEKGQIALPLGMENGSPIGTDLALLDEYFDRGIRYITLAHSLPNAVADSSYSVDRRNGGLSDFGRTVVKRMNELGIMVDISHVSDDAFYDVMEVTDVPAIASHSSARVFTPGFERNINDKMIKVLAAKGGIVMINYGSAFLTEDANQWRARREKGVAKMAAEQGLTLTDDVRQKLTDDYMAANPYPFATLDDVLDHIDHVVKLAGIDAVGIGSDYDGVGDSLPIGLKDVSSYPNLIEGLMLRGYSEDDIKKVLGGNLMRVWRTVEAAAQ